MKYEHPLKKILTETRPYWDQDKTPPEVRLAFLKTLRCRTEALGGEVFASETEEKVFYHTCKSRTCSSCGYRSTVQWQRARWAALPDMCYHGITFTMPDVLWPLFRDNKHLLKALPSLAAAVIQVHVMARHGVRVGVIAVLHTFNGKLEFNSHVHTMVTAGGLYEPTSSWVSHVDYDRGKLMKAWRRAVIALLRAAMHGEQLSSPTSPDQTDTMLTQQENRWWSINLQSFQSKAHFLSYAGRYARRPPIAQRRITNISDGKVTFWAKDKRQGRRVEIVCTLEEFIDLWAQHILKRCQHAIRSFGLFAPRALNKTSAAIFAILGQRRRVRPKPRPWAVSLKRDFGHDPLLDHLGKRMKRVRRIAPVTRC